MKGYVTTRLCWKIFSRVITYPAQSIIESRSPPQSITIDMACFQQDATLTYGGMPYPIHDYCNPVIVEKPIPVAKITKKNLPV